ncbi:uncharacterized protein BJX67DRAFT_360308 [Aspergillus lucknowensis]|uniref:Uncharacterized protein n=1 Tax=Aspergillus lucknowensis TaxID=176173 RepID=A0ABR4LJZ0_9EURO
MPMPMAHAQPHQSADLPGFQPPLLASSAQSVMWRARARGASLGASIASSFTVVGYVRGQGDVVEGEAAVAAKAGADKDWIRQGFD